MWQCVVGAGALCAAVCALRRFYLAGGTCTVPGRLDGKLVVITGANSGIGRETAAELARRGARVIMACRSEKRALAAKEVILSRYGETSSTALTANVAEASLYKFITPIKPDQLIIEDLDLSSLDSIRAFAARICKPETRINYLINNAGIMACPYGETKDGFELQMGTNYLGHFLLTELLLPAIKRAGPGSRIINLSSLAHYKATINPEHLNLRGTDYGRMAAYRQSKLANILHSNQLAKRLQIDGIVTASVHPGVVSTEILKVPMASVFQIISTPLLKTAWEGAQTTLYTVLTPDLESGAYYSDCAKMQPSALSMDEDLAEKLWKASEKAVGLR